MFGLRSTPGSKTLSTTIYTVPLKPIGCFWQLDSPLFFFCECLICHCTVHSFTKAFVCVTASMRLWKTPLLIDVIGTNVRRHLVRIAVLYLYYVLCVLWVHINCTVGHRSNNNSIFCMYSIWYASKVPIRKGSFCTMNRFAARCSLFTW